MLNLQMMQLGIPIQIREGWYSTNLIILLGRRTHNLWLRTTNQVNLDHLPITRGFLETHSGNRRPICLKHLKLEFHLQINTRLFHLEWVRTGSIHQESVLTWHELLLRYRLPLIELSSSSNQLILLGEMTMMVLSQILDLRASKQTSFNNLRRTTTIHKSLEVD